MEEKKKTIIAVVAIAAIVAAVGFVAMQAMSGSGAGKVPEPETYVNQPPSDASRYRGEDNSATGGGDRM